MADLSDCRLVAVRNDVSGIGVEGAVVDPNLFSISGDAVPIGGAGTLVTGSSEGAAWLI
jgi:hypothetical protein